MLSTWDPSFNDIAWTASIASVCCLLLLGIDMGDGMRKATTSCLILYLSAIPAAYTSQHTELVPERMGLRTPDFNEFILWFCLSLCVWFCLSFKRMMKVDVNILDLFGWLCKAAIFSAAISITSEIKYVEEVKFDRNEFFTYWISTFIIGSLMVSICLWGVKAPPSFFLAGCFGLCVSPGLYFAFRQYGSDRFPPISSLMSAWEIVQFLSTQPGSSANPIYHGHTPVHGFKYGCKHLRTVVFRR